MISSFGEAAIAVMNNPMNLRKFRLQGSGYGSIATVVYDDCVHKPTGITAGNGRQTAAQPLRIAIRRYGYADRQHDRFGQLFSTFDKNDSAVSSLPTGMTVS